jgi:uncharacterized protein
MVYSIVVLKIDTKMKRKFFQEIAMKNGNFLIYKPANHKRTNSSLALIRLLFASLFALLPIISFAQNQQILEDTARKFFGHLINKEVGEMEKMFSDEFLKIVPTGQVKEIADGLESQLGKFDRIKRSLYNSAPPYEIITLVVRFGERDWGLNVTMDSNQKVAGFHFTMAPPEKYTPSPAYADTTRFIEKSVMLDCGDIKLPGMISIPLNAQKVPIVVLVHGSGVHDMDESIGPNKIFRDIAHGLASRGIAVLRYEKRNFNHQYTLERETFTVWDEAGSDALHAINLAGTLPGVDTTKIYLAGHSLGAMIAPRIAQRAPHLAGIISLAGTPRYLSDLLPLQFEHLATIRPEQSESALDGLTEAKDFAALMKKKREDHNVTYDASFLGMSAEYWKDLNSHDTGSIAASLPQSILIIQAGRDYQVSMVEYEAWKQALASHHATTFHLFEDLDHLFFKGEGPSNPSDYLTENNVDERIIKAIWKWIMQ